MNDTDLDGRLVAMETALAHHEAQLHDLSDEIAKQWDLIDGLGRRMERVEALLGRIVNNNERDDGESPA